MPDPDLSLQISEKRYIGEVSYMLEVLSDLHVEFVPVQAFDGGRGD